jgi:predicted small metal-binding protein
MAKQVNCPCGETVTGESDDELVTNVEAHIQDKHPDMVGTMSREQILDMAQEAAQRLRAKALLSLEMMYAALRGNARAQPARSSPVGALRPWRGLTPKGSDPSSSERGGWASS